MAKKTVLVTGGNTGIGFALCKLLATEHDCDVLLGSRSEAKGAAAVAEIQALKPSGRVQLLVIDVADDASVAAAAAEVTAKGLTLFAIVNNAGVGLQTGIETQGLLNINYKGPIRVSEAFKPLVDARTGRIVNMSSGVASMWLRNQDAATKALYSNPDLTQEALDADVAKQVAADNADGPGGSGYGLSKAALTAYTLIQAKQWPNLVCCSVTPGFINTNMTKGFGAKLTPEQGCRSSLKCLFEDVTSGFYYGSDGLRSPLTCTRDPGTPEYGGEPDPDPAKYNK